MVGGSAAALSEVWGELQRAAGATDRLAELLKAEDSISDPSTAILHPNLGRGRLTFENVIFNYPSRPKYSALDDVFDVKTGQTVAIVGPSGAGKTTIIHLLRFTILRAAVYCWMVLIFAICVGKIFVKLYRLCHRTRGFSPTACWKISVWLVRRQRCRGDHASNLAAAHQFILSPEDMKHMLASGVMLSGG